MQSTHVETAQRLPYPLVQLLQHPEAYQVQQQDYAEQQEKFILLALLPEQHLIYGLFQREQPLVVVQQVIQLL